MFIIFWGTVHEIPKNSYSMVPPSYKLVYKPH